MGASSTTASLALLLSIPVVIWLLLNKPRAQAISYALFGCALFLPERTSIVVPYITLDKNTIPGLVIFLYLLVAKAEKIQKKQSGFFGLMLFLFIVGNVFTVLNNRDPIALAPGVILPGLNISNIITRTVNALLWNIVPFVIGRKIFCTTESVKTLLTTMSTMALIYTLFIMVELRASPQMNMWVYGYHQHDFEQTVRDGGYRPMVFMSHGLALTLFYVMGIFASITLYKSKLQVKALSAKMRSILMGFILSLCHSMGALFYGIAGVPVLLRASPKFIARLATIGALLILAVPLMRAMELIPIEDIVAFIADIHKDRAASLQFRFQNEELLLDKWESRPWFGFGTGRNAVFDESGSRSVVFDGAWIIILSDSGMFGFLVFFSILLGPIWLARRQIESKLDDASRHMLTGLVMMVVVGTFELLINGLFNNLVLLLAGCLYGYCETLAAVPRRGKA